MTLSVSGVNELADASLSFQSIAQWRDAGYLDSLLSLSEQVIVLDAGQEPKLRGMVDVYDGARHILQGLIVAAEVDEVRPGDPVDVMLIS